jgi:hypothetical protein
MPDRYGPWTVPRYFEYVCPPQKYKLESSILLAIFYQCSARVVVAAYVYVPKKLGFFPHDVLAMLKVSAVIAPAAKADIIKSLIKIF